MHKIVDTIYVYTVCTVFKRPTIAVIVRSIQNFIHAIKLIYFLIENLRNVVIIIMYTSHIIKLESHIWFK